MNNLTFADKAINYFLNLQEPFGLPKGIYALNPYRKSDVQNAVTGFYKKYFNDNKKRIFIWGINPGRFGGGLTGIPFTDPVALREECNIDNRLGAHKELSSKFIYQIISAFGGTEKFFERYYLTALYSLPLIKDGKNYNFYDDKDLFSALESEIFFSVKQQVEFGADQELAVCLGIKNYKFLKPINDKFKFFKRIEILEHPRYILQYKSKLADVYIKKYLNVLSYCLPRGSLKKN